MKKGSDHIDHYAYVSVFTSDEQNFVRNLLDSTKRPNGISGHKEGETEKRRNKEMEKRRKKACERLGVPQGVTQR